MRAETVSRLRRVSRLRERRAVQDAGGFVTHLLEDAADGAIVFGDALFAGSVGRLADARNECERAVEGADDVADADTVRRAAELVAAVRTLLALDQPRCFSVSRMFSRNFLGMASCSARSPMRMGPWPCSRASVTMALRPYFPLRVSIRRLQSLLSL